MAQAETSKTCVDRQTLYEELWRIPGTQLARKYGVSDVALGKACRRHDIPRPPVGYWMMRKHGYEVERTPLPPISDPRLREVEFHPVPTAPARAEIEGKASPAPGHIRVAEQLASPHPLVEAARKQLRAATAGENRIVSTNPETALNISVAAASVTRALKLIDALIRAWEKAGGEVTPGVKDSDHHYQTAFAIGPDKALINLTERTERIPDWKPSKDNWPQRYPPHRPNGSLVFTVHYWRREGLRSTWADGKRQPLEDKLDSIFDGLLLHVQDAKSHRLDSECEGRQKAAAEQRRAVREAYEQEDKLRSEHLAKEVDAWLRASHIRGYLAALRQAVDAGKMRVTDENAYAEWTDWVGWYADHIDPMVLLRTRPGRTKPPQNMPIDALEFTSFTTPVIAALGVADADALYNVRQKQIEEIEKQHSGRIWWEICRVLEGLGYNMTGRKYW